MKDMQAAMEKVEVESEQKDKHDIGGKKFKLAMSDVPRHSGKVPPPPTLPVIVKH